MENRFSCAIELIRHYVSTTLRAGEGTRPHTRFDKSNKKGVALIFFLLCFGLILGFMMLVINTGMIVYQKMRLQTAVDLAAYAGASVQASYLGNAASGDQSIKNINAKILKRYGQLLEELTFGTVAPWPQGFPEVASCVASCMAASLANANYAASLYKKASTDMDEYRQQIARILAELPKATRGAVEQTIKLNIPDLEVQEGGLGSVLGDTTNDPEDFLKSLKDNPLNKKKKNAILSFSSKKGMYLANVVAAVPHTFAFYGPDCWNRSRGLDDAPYWYCSVNGVGVPGGKEGYSSAALAFARTKMPIGSGNIGNISKIAPAKSEAIRTMFIPNYHRPDPFVMVSAEWYPENGSFMNLENSLGAKGSLFPKKTRLVAMAAAEPFGGNLMNPTQSVFGVRLQSIRKIALDPRLKAIKDDFPKLFDYFQALSPVDSGGKAMDTAEDVARRFLH